MVRFGLFLGLCGSLLPLWAGLGEPIPGIEGEVVEVTKLQGNHGTFRGFEWCKEGDVFYITSQRQGAEGYLANDEEIQAYLDYKAKQYRSHVSTADRSQETLSAPVPEDYPQDTLVLHDYWYSLFLRLSEKGIQNYQSGEHLKIMPRSGNLRINYPEGTVVMKDLKLAGDLILNVRHLVNEGGGYCFNGILLPCETERGHDLPGRELGSYGVSEQSVATSRYFRPYNGHNLIRGSSVSAMTHSSQ